MNSQNPTPVLPEDGYDWLKYGQKYCQGEGSTRLYFRCKENRDSNCPAKKTVDCVNRPSEAQKIKVMYTENHNHEAPRAVPESAVTDGTVPGTNGSPDNLSPQGMTQSAPTLSSPAGRKTAASAGSKYHREPDGVQNVHMAGAGDALLRGFPTRIDAHVSELKKAFTTKKSPSKDGYDWLKYGQKNLYGNVFTRTYYRCRMNKSNNCPAKKTIDTINNRSFQGERSFNHGEHNHPPRLEPSTAPKSWRGGSADSTRSESATSDPRGLWNCQQSSTITSDSSWRQGGETEGTKPLSNNLSIGQQQLLRWVMENSTPSSGQFPKRPSGAPGGDSSFGSTSMQFQSGFPVTAVQFPRQDGFPNVLRSKHDLEVQSLSPSQAAALSTFNSAPLRAVSVPSGIGALEPFLDASVSQTSLQAASQIFPSQSPFQFQQQLPSSSSFPPQTGGLSQMVSQAQVQTLLSHGQPLQQLHLPIAANAVVLHDLSVAPLYIQEGNCDLELTLGRKDF